MDKKEFTLRATIENGKSQKGTEYEYLNLQLTKDYSKRVFLEQSELLLMKLEDNKLIFPQGK